MCDVFSWKGGPFPCTILFFFLYFSDFQRLVCVRFASINWVSPYHRLFPNKLLFPIDSKVFGCTCFVRDVHPQVSKLDPKYLKCIFMGYSCVQKGYRCYCPTLRCYFVSIDITFFETTLFSLSSSVTSQGEGDDLFVYTISSLVPPAPPTPTPTPVPVKPPIT